MARLSHADQNRFPLPRLDLSRAAGPRSGLVHGSGAALRHAWHSGMAVLLLQGAHDRSRPVPRARRVNSVDEAEKHAPFDARRRSDYAFGAGILRLAPDSAWLRRTAIHRKPNLL